MTVNKVVYNGKTLIDLTGDTVTPESLAEGVTAHTASGSIIQGTAPISQMTSHINNQNIHVPEVTASDVGKLLIVNEDGKWVVARPILNEITYDPDSEELIFK